MRLVSKLLIQLLMPTMLTVSIGCSNEDEDMLGTAISSSMNKEKVEEVRRLITAELQVGVEAQAIEAFFDRHGITYSYDRFNQSYNGIIRDVSSVLDQAVVIRVYVDEEKRFQRAEVRDSFTAP